MSEYDKELVYEILSQVRSSAERILRRFEPVQSPEDFTCDEAGLEKLDAICMQLIAIGENRDRGRPRSPRPPTPPCVRVRTRRFT
jgi:hypothetical protein